MPVQPRKARSHLNVKFAARKPSTDAASRREQLTHAHLSAASMRKVYPEIGQLRIELCFSDSETRLPPPSPQLRTLYSAAPAFFRFACPCADCDGVFDLTAEVTAMVSKGTSRNRALSLDGRLPCQGVRFRHQAAIETPCAISLSFKLRAEPLREA